MKIEMCKLSDIKPFENNPRRINDAAVDAVARSIREFGFRQPIVVDEHGVIIVGHIRYKAAIKLGLKEAPVHVIVGLTPAQIKAYRIADNQTNRLSDWDQDRLVVELMELQKLDFDLDLTGFTAEDLCGLLSPPNPEGLIDPDAVPEPPDEAITKPGDLWILGKHRLLCGDSSRPEDVDRLLGDQSVHLVTTDPPYGVRVEPRSNNARAAGLSSFETTHHPRLNVEHRSEKSQPTTRKMRAKDRPLANDFLSEQEYCRLLHAWFANMARVLLPGRAYFLWGGYSNIANYPPVLKAHGLYFSQCLIWHKMHPVMTRKDFMGDHEWCFYGWREGAAHQFFGPKNVPDVWPIKKVNPQSMVHLTEKPVELAERAMTYCSKQGENVLDLFGGSGSSLIAAERTGRKAFLMEVDEPYCDVIVRRWEEFTGKKAERVKTSA